MCGVKHRSFKLLAGISLILFLGLSAIWARSYSKAEDLVYYGRSVSGAVHDAKGRLAFVFTNAMWSNPHFEYSSSAPAPGLDYANPPYGSHTSWNRLGFYFSRVPGCGQHSTRQHASTRHEFAAGGSLHRIRRSVLGSASALALPPFWNYVLPLVLWRPSPAGRRSPVRSHEECGRRNACPRGIAPQSIGVAII